MPRGFKRDQAATLLAEFKNRRSFVSQPKTIEGEGADPKPHLILHGQDKGQIRAEIFRRNREANGGVNRCWKCGREVFEQSHYPITMDMQGQWHHLRNKPGQRCDCPENGVVSCETCHRPEHPQVRWTAQEQTA